MSLRLRALRLKPASKSSAAITRISRAAWRADMRFPIEFDAEVESLSSELKRTVSESLLELVKGNQDITGASIAAEEPAQGQTGHLFEARIVLYMRPSHIFASHKAESLEGALKGALQAIERQVREQRDKLGKPWQRPDSGV